MIFKTFDSDIDKISSKWGMFGKSFNDFANNIKNYKSAIKDLTNQNIRKSDAKKQVGSLWSNLFSNKKDLKEQFIDVMPKIDESNIADSLSKIKDMSKSVAEGKKTWQDLFDTLPEGEKHLAKLGKEMEGQIITEKGLIKANKAARESAIAHNNALKQQTLGAKAATVAAKALSVALNVGVMWAISEVITTVATGLHDLATESERAKENADSFASSVNSLNENIASDSSKLSDLNSKYQELSKGVNNLGENVSLSTSEYDEYKDIISQVSDIMPSLTTYFNAQGEKIGFVKGKLSDLNDEYERTIKTKAKDLFYNGNEEGATVQDTLDNIENNKKYGKFESVWKTVKAGFATLFGKASEDTVPTEDALNGLKDLQNKSRKEIYNYLKKVWTFADFEEGERNVLRKTLADMLDISDVDDILEYNDEKFQELQYKIAAKIEQFSADIESDVAKGRSDLINALHMKEDFWDDSKLNDKQRDSITTLVSSFNSELWDDLNLKSQDDIAIFAQKLIDNVSKDGDFSKAWSQLFGKGIDKLPVNEYVTKVRSLISTIGNAIGLKTDDQQNKLLSSLGFDNLDELVNDYNGAIKSAAEKWKLDDSQKEDLEKFFEENSINTKEEIDTWKEIAAEADNAAEAKRKYLTMDAVDKTAQQLEALKETYESVSENVSSLTTALSESVSGTGLSSDSVDAVTSMFSDLKGYDEDKLLDKTANGLRLNTRELEKLKKEYDDNTAKEFYQNVEDAYNSWQDALRNGEEQSVVDSLYDQYQQAAQLADQYVGLTSAYNKWQEALSTANEGDMYDSIYNNIKSVKELYKKGLVGTDDFRTYVDLISPKDLAGATTEEVVRAYQQSIGKIERYFTDGHKGAENFLKDVQKINSEWAHMNKDGSWEIDFGAGGSSDKDVAKRLGIDVEALQAILRKLVDYGFYIDFGDSFGSLEMMGVAAEKAYSKLKELGKIGKKMKFKFDTGDISRVNTQIEDAKNVLNTFRDKDGNVDVNVKGAKEAQTILAKLLTEKQEIEKPAILQVDASQLSGKAVGVVSMLQRIQQEINTYDIQMKIGADTSETEKKIKSDIKAIKSNYGKELSDIHIDFDDISSAKDELKKLGKDDIDVMVNAIVNHKEVDAYKKEKKETTLKVTTELDDKAVNEFMDKTLQKTIKAKVEVDSSELDKVSSKPSKKDSKNKEKEEKSDNKKSHANGTFNLLKGNLAKQGFANASGNISIPKDQTALVNELGEELIVRDGRWFTVKGGAQFTELKKGDIVFNHMQTRQLLKNGKITSSNNRGKMAYNAGSTNGASIGSGIPGWTYSSSERKSQKKSSKSKKSSDKDKKKDSKQLIDWIERKLDVLQDKIDLTKAKFDNLFSVKRQKNNLTNQIEKTTKLLNAQQKAVTKYNKKADSIKLSEPLKKKVRNGDIKGSLSELIREYGEKTAKQINKYQDYIDKVKDAKKAVQELKAEIKDLSKQKLDLKLEDNERKRTYQEARYANATTAKEKHKILNKEINTYKSDNEAYKKYYQESKTQRNKSGKTAKSAVNNTKGLSKSEKNKIKKLIKQGKEIPSALMKKVRKHNTATYQKLLNYNNSVDFVADVLRDKKLAKEQNETNMREKRIERAQNYADEAEAKYNLNQQYETNAVSAKDKNKYEAESLKYLNKQYDKLIKIAELEGDATEQKRLQAEKQEKVNESYQKMYDNIKAEYDNKTGLNDARISTIQSEIATLEAAGQSVSKSLYDGMMKINEGTKEKLLKERSELEEAGKKFEYGSKEWYAWKNDMESIDQSLYSCTQQTIEFQKAINELDFKKFSLMAAQLDATKSHLDFLVDMLSHEELTSKESGGLTDEGFATISLRFSNMDNHKKVIENAQKELDKLYEKHADGTDGYNEEEFMAKREEQLDIIRDSTKAIADEKDAILDLVENALQVQVDSINELIEKKKNALATEKDLYEYQKKVAKQTKNIALIQKQIAALSGDHSEEARAKLQKLQVSLEEAQEELRDTEYDKWYDDQTDMLDTLADEVEDFWERIMNDLRKDINGSMDSLLQMVTDNPEAVARALDELGLGDALSIITTYNPDGTHTNSSIDYGGNSYESTYDKTGTNVNNKFDTSIDDTTSAADDLTYEVKRVTDTTSDLNKVLQDEKEAFGESVEKSKDNLVQAVQNGTSSEHNVADTTNNTATAGKETISDNNRVGKDAEIDSFLKKNLRKPKNTEESMRIATDKLLQYLDKKYNKKGYLTKAKEAELAEMLGISLKDKKNITYDESVKIRNAFKNAGFADGGIASTLNKAAKDNGDDGIITIQKGEAVLTKEETKAVKKIADRYIPVGSKITPEQERILMAHLGMPFEYTDMMPKYESVPVNNTNNTSVNTGDINVHLDGSGIVDMESMFQQLNQPRNKQRMSECVLGDIKNPFQNVLKKF